MKNNLAKKIAYKTLIKYKYYLLNNYTYLKNIIELNQFTIIEYKKHNNSEPVSELIQRLKLEEEIAKNNSFIYINNNLKLLFLNSNVSDEEKCALLRHELGHICDPNFNNSNLHYSNIQKEEFANEFSCYIKNPGICFIIFAFLIKKWVILVSAITLIACVLWFSFANNIFNILQAKPATRDASTTEISDSLYYVTSSGKKYHKKHCIIIKYKNNLTEIKLNDAINKGYNPCLICNPKYE